MKLNQFTILTLSMVLFSCGSSYVDQNTGHDKEEFNDQEVFDSASQFAEMVLGQRLRIHYTEHKRGNLGVDALFESDEMIGYTTFSNELYQKSPSPVDVEGCVLFAANFKNEESAEWAFNHLKSNSAIRASEVKGMVGIVPVQVRFLEQIRNAGALFSQQGNYVFYLPETCESPLVEANWEDYENLFIQSITVPNEEITVIVADCDTEGFLVQDVTASR